VSAGPGDGRPSDRDEVRVGMGTTDPVRILVVDDDSADVLMIEEALEQSGIAKTIDVVGDGREAMDFLRRSGRHVAAPRPDMILLDLNMPRMDGREVLGLVKTDPDLCTIPIVVLTTSNADGDILSSYALRANAYVTKPIDLDEFNAVVRHIDEFFGQVVVLPRRS
jgi:CheY-like chemotaxis protein